MKSRYLVLGLSLVLALALAVPALGGPTNPIASISASAQQTANKALKKAKAAQKTANAAQSTANAAQGTANDAQTAANAAQKTANTVQTAVKTAQTTANEAKTAAAGAQNTANEAKSAASAAQSTANGKLGNTETTFGEGSGSSTSDSKAVFAFCPTGQQITGGGFETSGTGSTSVTPTFLSSYGDAWVAVVERINGQASTAWGIRAIAVCAGP